MTARLTDETLRRYANREAGTEMEHVMAERHRRLGNEALNGGHNPESCGITEAKR